MELRDNTIEINRSPDLESNYLYHLESTNGRWALAVEHCQEADFNVYVLYRESGWPLHGVIRYWKCAARDLAEARFLSLQTTFANLDAELPLAEMLAQLPPEERHAPAS